jgi:hypothetical protein
MPLRVFDTQLGVQGMESICELLTLFGSSLVTVWSISCTGLHSYQWVVLFLDHIHKKIPSGLGPIYSRFLCGNFLPISFPPMFDMGESLEECEGDLFPVGKIMNIEITF